jgi:hypothetical protein
LAFAAGFAAFFFGEFVFFAMLEDLVINLIPTDIIWRPGILRIRILGSFLLTKGCDRYTKNSFKQCLHLWHQGFQEQNGFVE